MDIRTRKEIEVDIRNLCGCPELDEIILRSAGREDVQLGGVIEILQSAYREYYNKYGDSLVSQDQFEANMCKYIEALLGEGDYTNRECTEWAERFYVLGLVDDDPPSVPV